MAIRDFLRNSGTKEYKKYDGEIGLEIETETKSSEAYPTGFLVEDGRGRWTAPSLKFWDVHVDGSLRDFGLEYVLKQPVKYEKELPAALDEFRDKTSKVKFIKDSVSTSVHVHLNMLNESFKTLGNFFTLYSMFENLLIRYSGPDRLSNLFCLPICDAEQTYMNMRSMMQQVQAKNYKNILYSEGNVKYAACNLSAFNAYGSIEIRSFRGETDTKQIYDWVSILYKILEYSRKDISPKEIMVSWKDREKKFLDDVFQEYRKHLSHKEEMELIDRNLWYAASIAYSVKDWNALDAEIKIPEFKPKQKELDLAAGNLFGLAWINLDNAQQEYVINYLRRDYEKKYFNNTKKKSPLDPIDIWHEEANRRLVGAQIRNDQVRAANNALEQILNDRRPWNFNDIPDEVPVANEPIINENAVEDDF